MENASKALIIVGSIIIAILTISIFYFSFGKVSSLTESVSENTEQKELTAFNISFEAYNKKVMYGADIISVLNKAIDNNRNYSIEYYSKPTEPKLLDYYVNVIFEYKGVEYNLMQQYTKPTGTAGNLIQEKFLNMTTKSDKDPQYQAGSEYKDAVDEFHEFKFTAFQCTDIKYTSEKDLKIKSAIGAVGRVRELTFRAK